MVLLEMMFCKRDLIQALFDLGTFNPQGVVG